MSAAEPTSAAPESTPRGWADVPPGRRAMVYATLDKAGNRLLQESRALGLRLRDKALTPDKRAMYALKRSQVLEEHEDVVAMRYTLRTLVGDV